MGQGCDLPRLRLNQSSCTYRWDGKQYGCAQEDPVKDWNNYDAKE
jgi:hypothetical protein